MTTAFPVKSVAACFGLAAFAVAIVSGLAAGRGMQEILGGAIASLFVCFAIGAVIGVIAERAINEGAARYRAAEDTMDESAEPDDAPAKGSPA